VYSTYGLEFEEKSPINAGITDIVFMFIEDARHADGRKFSNSSVEKAHAFEPVNGEIHFNDFLKYSVEKKNDNEVSLFYVSLHEIGHALGLKHSPLKDAVMNAM
jgi:predicted Zn-dependent protease